MDTKSILLALPELQALVDIAQSLGSGWDATSVSSEADALAQLERRSFDALLVDFNLGSPDASQLLNLALERRPEMTRFLLAYEADLALVAAFVSGPHEILPKPIEPASLKCRIDSGVAPRESDPQPGGGDLRTDADASPAIPAVYAEVLKALELPGVTDRQVGDIIAGDPALTLEVLNLSASTYRGLPGNSTEPGEAVEALGLEAVRALVMARKFLSEHSQLNPGYLSIEKLWQHSTQVAQLARDLMLFETKDRALASEALVAGLLHDLGKVVLAANFDDLYGRVHSLARKQPVPLWDIEKEMFGATHGEIGACLVGMWNMPSSVVQAAAFHHEPPMGEHQHLTPLAAVHIANVLEHECRPSDGYRVAPVHNPAFLNELGLLQRLPVWRAAFANRRAVSVIPEPGLAETGQPQLNIPALSSTPPPLTANELPALSAPTRTGTLGQSEGAAGMPVAPVSRPGRWVYVGAAALLLGLLALWFEPRPELPIRALTSAPVSTWAPVLVPPAGPPEPAPVAAAEATAELAGSEESLATDADADPIPMPTLPDSEPTVATAPQVDATSAPPPALAPQEKAWPHFRLSGIIYTVARPVAIMNGQTVYVGDRVNGATVISIDRTQVTLQIDGQRKTCILE